MVTGPFADTYKYVTYIALDNCVEYFVATKHEEESGKANTSSHYRRQRLLHNAAIAINSIVDWIHEDDHNESNLATTRRRIEEECPAMVEIAKIANAAKHRFRRKDGTGELRTDVPHASELVETSSTIAISGDGVRLEFRSDLDRLHESIEQAFRYWVNWQTSER